ncbi:sensor histidine kinase [Modestobacter sp. Leaf380]|uniref:sensor histidine kinase n=1 Tax=Modestobacter sp. Leaf380 TaxID=1736356 RepID=UPI0006F86CE9|nr:sensor histidine kinase [Modestobacter sp. Leaf380]KQS63899.1 hypothetical protein ASG41_17280 [Modestobacter sp. Leaf380]
MARRPTSLAGRLLAFQLGLVAVVVLGVAAVSVAQSRYATEAGADRRARAVAEYAASVPVLRFELTEVAADGAQIAPVVEDLRTTSDVDSIVVTDAAGLVLAAPDDPRLLRTTLTPGDGDAAAGWSGGTTLGDRDVRAARAPVLGDDGALLGTVVVAIDDPSTAALLVTALPDLLTYLVVAGVLGVAGSVFLARRVKRQTLGLEPAEIASLTEHREAMLHGIREGVLGLDVEGRVTLVNEAAVELLDLPEDCVGTPLADHVPEEPLLGLLTGRSGTPEPDRMVVRSGRLLVLTRTDLERGGRALGSVTTLRDHTELVALQQQLVTSRDVSETLRAQTHEFANRLHTISGLVQLGLHDDVVGFIEALGRDSAAADAGVGRQLADPTVAALVVAKASLARERGAVLEVSADSGLPRVAPGLAADLVTVLGNLVDNALDAVGPTPGAHVLLTALVEGDDVLVEVADDGPGVDPAVLHSVFRRGVSTKDGEGRGHGLALVQLVCGRRGGDVRVDSPAGGGAVFTARLPVHADELAAPVGAA